MLSFIVFFPLLGVAIIALLPKERERDSKWVAAGTAFVVLVAAVGLFAAFDRDLFARRAHLLRERKAIRIVGIVIADPRGIPEEPKIFIDELESVSPVILNEDLSKVI